MISEEALTRKVREKLEDIDGITRLEQALTKEIVEEFSQEVRQKTSVMRQEIKSQIETPEHDLERVVDEEPLVARAKRRVFDRTYCEIEESRETIRPTRRKNTSDKLCRVSGKMADFVGAQEISRRNLRKLMHRYFEFNGLRDPQNKRYVISNSVLKDLFNVVAFTKTVFGALLNLM